MKRFPCVHFFICLHSGLQNLPACGDIHLKWMTRWQIIAIKKLTFVNKSCKVFIKLYWFFRYTLHKSQVFPKLTKMSFVWIVFMVATFNRSLWKIDKSIIEKSVFFHAFSNLLSQLVFKILAVKKRHGRIRLGQGGSGRFIVFNN